MYRPGDIIVIKKGVATITDKLTIYHGSAFIIENPEYGKGNPHNDYGPGFYCTETEELAKEWACSETQSGFANKYILDVSGLSILDLSNEEYNILNWLAILLVNRTFDINAPIAQEGWQYITENFLPKYDSFDVIYGYRADDSYFSFATAFLNNTISIEQLKNAMHFGGLGMQTVLKSKRAFNSLRFESADFADAGAYYPKKAKRDFDARKSFRDEKTKTPISESKYLLDIIREAWKNDDTRLR